MKRERMGGINAVEALLQRHPERVTQIWFGAGGPRLDALKALARESGVSTQSAHGAGLDKLVDGEHHQGVVAEFQPEPPLAEADLERLAGLAGRELLLVVLDQVQDPHNLGACLRSAAAAGAHAVVVPRDRAAGLTSAARRAAAGAAETLPLVEVPNLARALERLQKLGVWCVGLAADAENSIYQTGLTGPLALVVGGEERGLRRLTRERCDGLARIPMPGKIESLNVSVATGIVLFEALRQRSK
ncbi:MAG: 23S rRNA (guanosine(2251)-2'-O)-methyltransferase RlmB [Wenzhouxiangellaceae bacterium]|nr:23S rRNA (guanosine(2251)-2'-O)-methyltransferase RlmB [Wenzhouxiangellaceae bacterium]